MKQLTEPFPRKRKIAWFARHKVVTGLQLNFLFAGFLVIGCLLFLTYELLKIQSWWAIAVVAVVVPLTVGYRRAADRFELWAFRVRKLEMRHGIDVETHKYVLHHMAIYEKQQRDKW